MSGTNGFGLMLPSKQFRCPDEELAFDKTSCEASLQLIGLTWKTKLLLKPPRVLTLKNQSFHIDRANEQWRLANSRAIPFRSCDECSAIMSHCSPTSWMRFHSFAVSHQSHSPPSTEHNAMCRVGRGKMFFLEIQFYWVSIKCMPTLGYFEQNNNFKINLYGNLWIMLLKKWWLVFFSI